MSINSSLVVILAGGKGKRLDGQGKFSVNLRGLSLIQHVINRLVSQTKNIVINTSYENKFIHKLGYKCIEDVMIDSDSLHGYGPLAGIHSALNYGSFLNGKSSYVITVPVDTPFLPNNLIKKFILSNEKHEKKISVASSKGRIHPTIAMWPCSLKNNISKALRDGIRKIDSFTEVYKIDYLNWNDKNDPFFNINSPNDLLEAEKRIDLT